MSHPRAQLLASPGRLDERVARVTLYLRRRAQRKAVPPVACVAQCGTGGVLASEPFTEEDRAKLDLYRATPRVERILRSLRDVLAFVFALGAVALALWVMS